MESYTLDGLPRLNRRYVPYKNSPLPTTEDKLLFVLLHIKQNLTQEIQGQMFGMIQSDVNKWLKVLRPVLEAALERLELVPPRLAAALEQAEHPEADEPLFSIMMVPNDRSSDQQIGMNEKNTGAEKRNATP